MLETLLRRFRVAFNPFSLLWLEYLVYSGRTDIRGYYYDWLTLLVMRKALKTDAVCIDVGCHQGAVLREMMQTAPEGTFLAFEPLPHLYERLLHTFKGPQVRCFNSALSNVDGETSFIHVASNPGYSGLKRRAYDRENEEEKEIRVQTRVLDAILESERVGKVDFIKIDVEGAEQLVMEGARQCLARDKPVVVFEHGRGGSDYFGKTPDDVFSLLAGECGMRISLLPDWLRGRPSLTLPEFRDQYYSGKNFFFIAHA